MATMRATRMPIFLSSPITKPYCCSAEVVEGAGLAAVLGVIGDAGDGARAAGEDETAEAAV